MIGTNEEEIDETDTEPDKTKRMTRENSLKRGKRRSRFWGALLIGANTQNSLAFPPSLSYIRNSQHLWARWGDNASSSNR